MYISLRWVLSTGLRRRKTPGGSPGRRGEPPSAPESRDASDLKTRRPRPRLAVAHQRHSHVRGKGLRDDHVVLDLARSVGPLCHGVSGPQQRAGSAPPGRGDRRRGDVVVGPADARDARDGRPVGYGPALAAGRRVLGRLGDFGGLLFVRVVVRLVLVVEGLQREPSVGHFAAASALGDVRVVLAHRLVPQHLQLGVHAPKLSPYVFRIHVCQIYVRNIHLSVRKNGFVEFQILWMWIRNLIR